jgi:hypothetical protein
MDRNHPLFVFHFTPTSADELLMAMLFHTSADDFAVRHIERREKCGDAVPLLVVGHGAGTSLLHRQPGWVRSNAWIWLFSSTESTIA